MRFVAVVLAAVILYVDLLLVAIAVRIGSRDYPVVFFCVLLGTLLWIPVIHLWKRGK